MNRRAIVNTQTGEWFDAEDAALYEEGDIPLNWDVIREHGDDIRSFYDSVVSSIGAPNVHVVEDMSATDGHTHVVMFVDAEARDALRTRLMDADMRGVGYSAFIEHAVRLSRDLRGMLVAAAHEAATSPDVSIWCDHTPGLKPACEQIADERMAAEGSWTR